MSANREPGLAPGWLAGRVVGRDGRPLADATAIAWTVIDRERTAVRAACDSDGRFRLGPLPAGPDHVLWCEAPGHARLRVGDDQVADVPVFPDATHDLGDLVLGDEAVAVGEVVDPEGLPLSGAEVTLTLYMQQLARTLTPNGPPFAVRTASDGMFRIGSLAAGPASVEIAVAGHPRLQVHTNIDIATRALDFATIRLEGGTSTMSGRVTDLAGWPIESAIVTANLDDEVTAVTDAGGRFTLRARAPVIRWASVRCRDSSRRTTVRVADPLGVNFRIEPPRHLEGWIRDAETSSALAIEDLAVCRIVRRDADGTVEFAG
jgi:hypothetical protein